MSGDTYNGLTVGDVVKISHLSTSPKERLTTAYIIHQWRSSVYNYTGVFIITPFNVEYTGNEVDAFVKFPENLAKIPIPEGLSRGAIALHLSIIGYQLD